jgi:two-component system nitrogen regulation response regulator GlnG
MHAYDNHDFPRTDAVSSVWVVDDDRSSRWVLEKALAREGIAHKSFASVYEVTQALLHGEPQVIVTDIRMPGESGLALLGKLKERHPTVRVIIMTA